MRSTAARVLLVLTLLLLIAAAGVAITLKTGPYAVAKVALAGRGPEACLLDIASERNRMRCLTDETLALAREPGVGPRRAVARLDRRVARDEWLAVSCHTAMHDVGDRYARAERVGERGFRRLLPRTGTDVCGTGFTHGLMRAALDDLESAADVRELVSVCERTPTAIEAYSCVHGAGHALRQPGDGTSTTEAAATCDEAAGGDWPGVACAQGTFHEHWIERQRGAPESADDRWRQARRLCEPVPAGVRPVCWYRGVEYAGFPPVRVDRSGPEACGALDAEDDRADCLAAFVRLTAVDVPGAVRLCQEEAPAAFARCFRGYPAIELEEEGRTAAEDAMLECAVAGDDAGECVGVLASQLAVLDEELAARIDCEQALTDSALVRACEDGLAAPALDNPYLA